MKLKRKISRVGSGLIVCLPSFWLRLNGLKKGDEIEMEVFKSFLKIKPIKKSGC